jgi:hypothetical protein
MNAVRYTTTTKKPCAPNDYDRCYAGCRAPAVGVTERWENGTPTLVYACKRHTDPTIKLVKACRYCGDETRKGSLSLGDGFEAHHRCHREAERENRI